MDSQTEIKILRELRSLRKELSEIKSSISPKSTVIDEFLNFNQASKMLGISSIKMYQMLKNEELPFATKFGSRWRFSKNALIKYLSKA